MSDLVNYQEPNTENIMSEIDKLIEDIPFGNTLYQMQHFVVDQHATPARQYRQIMLELSGRKQTLEENIRNLKKSKNRINYLNAEIDILQYEQEVLSKEDFRKQTLISAKIEGKKIQIEEKQSGAAYNQKLIKDCAKICDFLASKAKELLDKHGPDIANTDDEEDEYWQERFSNNILAEKLARSLQVDVGTAQSILQLPEEAQAGIIDKIQVKGEKLGLLVSPLSKQKLIAPSQVKGSTEEKIRFLLKDDPEKMYWVLGQHPIIQEGWLAEMEAEHNKNNETSPIDAKLPERFVKQDESNKTPDMAIGVLVRDDKDMEDFITDLQEIKVPKGMTKVAYIAKGQTVAKGRNGIVQSAIQEGAKYLFFVDSDVLVPYYAFETLLATMKEKECMVVCGNYPLKKKHYEAVNLINTVVEGENYINSISHDTTGLVDCNWIAACGCMLIDMRVFASLQYPYFKENLDKQSETECFFSEDAYFTESLLHNGNTPIVDTDLKCIHIDRENMRAYGHKDIVNQDTYKIKNEKIMVDYPLNRKFFDIIER
jgi:hypothetical protein